MPGVSESKLSNAYFHSRCKSRSSLICFSHLRWNFVYQRPQHLMSRAARDHDVYFFEEPRFEEGASYALQRTTDPSGVNVLTPVFPLGISERAAIDAQRRQVLQLFNELPPHELIAWYYTPMALRFSADLAPDLCVYDKMDELSAFAKAPPELADWERKLFARADVVFAGGQSLHESALRMHPNAHLFPSSVDAAHFASARAQNQAEPPDQKGIPRPRLGFFGVIDERMDLALVAGLAEMRPEWQFVMIGPVAKIDPKSLVRRPNIHWLGGKQYAELPSYLAGWDLGIMPFALNEATRFISPTKTPEFLAAGLRVVSTPVPDVVRTYGETALVEIAGNPASFIAEVERLLSEPKARWLAEADRHLAAMSWDQTWRGMHSLMHRRTLQPLRPTAARLGEVARV